MCRKSENVLVLFKGSVKWIQRGSRLGAVRFFTTFGLMVPLAFKFTHALSRKRYFFSSLLFYKTTIWEALCSGHNAQRILRFRTTTILRCQNQVSMIQFIIYDFMHPCCSPEPNGNLNVFMSLLAQIQGLFYLNPAFCHSTLLSFLSLYFPVALCTKPKCRTSTIFVRMWNMLVAHIFI